MTSPCRRSSFGLFLCVLGAAFAETKSADPIIELPKVVVTDNRELPEPESWRYGTIPGFEILSNASQKDTQMLIRDFQSFSFAVDVAWNGLAQKMAVPVSLIICGKGAKFDAFVPAQKDRKDDSGQVSLFLQNRDQAAIILDFEAKTVTIGSLGVTDVTGAGNPEAPPPTMREMAAANGEMEILHQRQLYREYIHLLMSRAQPRFPPWFEEGLGQLFMGMQFDGRVITFAKLEDPNLDSLNGGPQDSDFNRALEKRPLMPLQEMFTVARDSSTAMNPLGSTWAKQSQAFVHLCLYGENQRYQKQFVTFLLRLQNNEPPSEALFKECFKMSYREMLTTLRGYQQFSAYKSFEWRLPKGKTMPEPPLVPLREATQSEIGRIKGDALRLADHPEAAHRELIAPYIRGERDPRLLAALGLEEHAAGNDDRAEKFLEAAVREKVDSARPYLEYARLRQRAALAAPAASEGRFSAAQTNQILAPLREGRNHGPALHEIYELFGDTLLRSIEPPKKEDVQIMVDGVNLFHGARLGMVYQTALLCMRIGEMRSAAALAENGMLAAPDEKTRARFAELKAQLPSVPAQKQAAAPKP